MKINSKIYKLIHKLAIHSYRKMAFYRCSYILRTGEVCNRGCYHQKGCQIHQNSPSYVPCNECGKLTFSKYGTCDIHARKHRKMEQYYQKKLADLASTQELVSN